MSQDYRIYPVYVNRTPEKVTSFDAPSSAMAPPRLCPTTATFVTLYRSTASVTAVRTSGNDEAWDAAKPACTRMSRSKAPYTLGRGEPPPLVNVVEDEELAIEAKGTRSISRSTYVRAQEKVNEVYRWCSPSGKCRRSRSLGARPSPRQGTEDTPQTIPERYLCPDSLRWHG